jgi:hypothetical protein
VGRYCFTVRRLSVGRCVCPKVTSPPSPFNGSSWNFLVCLVLID